MVIVILLFLCAYLLGSIPTAVWVGKIFFGLDVRQHGSGNAGATNTIRVLGYKAGIPVMIIDVLKGFVAVKLATLTHQFEADTDAFLTLQLIYGSAALIGHIFPVFVNFRGGKGVATLFGVAFAIVPVPTLICIGVFFITLFISHYVSLSSMMAGIAFPFVVIFLFNNNAISLIIFSILIAVLLLITHQKNIERLLKNEESKADFLRLWKKRSSRT
jgi:glycerol-3-phosphate acyltransferase PlsY